MHIARQCGLEMLRRRYPWPSACPERTEDFFGWFHPRTAQMLRRQLRPSTRLVVELGTFLGLSTRAILLAAPAAQVISIDHGQAGMAKLPCAVRPEIARRLPTLDDQLRRNLWPWRDRVTLVEEKTLSGIDAVADCRLVPELVYVDAGHDFTSVWEDLSAVHHRWPRAVIVGDDWTWEGVRTAVAQFSGQHRRALEDNGVAYTLTPGVRG